MPAPICVAKTSYKKLPGTLEINDKDVRWTQDGKKASAAIVARHALTSLFCSKEGSAQVRIRIAGANGDEYTFTFTTPQQVALGERERFKRELTDIIGANRGSTSVAPSPQPSSPLSTTAPPTPTKLSARPSLAPTPQDGKRGLTIILPDAQKDFELRKAVLIGDKELANLHRDLVMSGQLSEAEFWEGREHRLYAQLQLSNQIKGKSGQLVDPRPETVDGEVKILLSTQLINDIFDEYPVMKRAYDENVVKSKKLTQGEFWHRYFQSKLFNAHRASIRSSAAQHVVNDDPIFDQYLEKADDELEPRKARSTGFSALVDLGASLEDHVETGNEKDITMQAGRQRGAIPLIRKFNEHSERLLNSALGEGPSNKRPRMDTGDEYSAIEIDDLQSPENVTGIELKMRGSQRYFESAKGTDGQVESTVSLDFRQVVNNSVASLQQWESDLSSIKFDKKAGENALLTMTQNVSNRLNVRSRKNDVPQDTFKQVTALQTAANEFLRQFWTAVYPPIADVKTLAANTPSSRQAKATKMASYLAKIPDKVNGLALASQKQGIDGDSIRAALKSVLDAVNSALAFHNTKVWV